jgi:hypothetical protein
MNRPDWINKILGPTVKIKERINLSPTVKNKRRNKMGLAAKLDLGPIH